MAALKYPIVLFASLLLCGAAHAQPLAYPSQPVQVVIPVTPGGATDIVTRAIAHRLEKMWNQRIVIEYRPGANGQIGANFVAKSPPNGYTLFATAETTLVINPSLFRTLTYDPFKDFVPIAGLGLVNQMLMVHPSVPAKTIQEFVALAKAKPDELTYSTFGIGSTGHLNMAAFLERAGIKMRSVHYKGGAPAVEAVIGGHVDALIISVGQAAPQWQAGRVRVLAVGSKQRLAEFPDLPTIAESGWPGFEAVAYFALVAPRGTPREIVEKINADVQRIMTDPAFKKEFLIPQRYEAMVGTPAEFGAYLKADAEKWARLIKTLGIKID